MNTIRPLRVTAVSPGTTDIEARVEGESAASPSYVASVDRQFRQFVEEGWGLGAVGFLAESKVLAGEVEDGPRSQLIVMPTIEVNLA